MNNSIFIRLLTAYALSVALLASPVALAMEGEAIKTEGYGKAGNWTLRRTVVGGTEISSCDMINFSGSERGLRYYYGEGRGEFGFSALASAASESPMNVEMWFSGDRANSQIVSMTLETDHVGYPWRTYGAPNSGPDGVLDDLALNSENVSFAYIVPGEGEHVETFSLQGYTDAAHMTTDCVNNPQLKAAKAAPAKAPAASAGGPKVIEGTCRLVVDGKAYVDIKKSCPIWMANDGTGTFWINADRETYLGDYFAEIMPAGIGTASGNWNGEKGATHAQSFLGEDFRQTKAGCWSNKRATICAAK